MKHFKFIAFTLAIALFSSVGLSAQEDKAGKIVTDYYTWLDAGNFDAVIGLLAEEFSATAPFTPVALNKAQWRGVGEGFKTAFPDIKHEIVEWFAKGNKVAVNAIFRGTNTGSMMGNPATGNKVMLPFEAIFELDGKGKIKRISIQFDNKQFEAQLMVGLASPQEMAKQNVLKIMEMLHRRSLDGVLAGFAPDARFNGWAPEAMDLNGYKQTMSDLLAAFPDSRFIVDDVVAEGNKVVVRHHFEGTHTGAAFQGVPVSNRKAKAYATVTFQLKNGFVQEAWLNADFLGLLTQIGAIPMGN